MAKYKPKDLKVKTDDELKEHLKLLRKEQFNCDLCRKTFITKQGFKGHVCYAHFGENHSSMMENMKEYEKLFQCKLCNKIFRSKLGL